MMDHTPEAVNLKEKITCGTVGQPFILNTGSRQNQQKNLPAYSGLIQKSIKESRKKRSFTGKCTRIPAY
jgi:hypothetical protein